ncbi:MAG: hypothetical protein WC979_06300 [Candidatus Pacearchaeota archaeon]|jgi:O-antigen/teichoic acid export membrane protein
MAHHSNSTTLSVDVQIIFLVVCLILIPMGLLIPGLSLLGTVGIWLLVGFVVLKFIKKVLELDR